MPPENNKKIFGCPICSCHIEVYPPDTDHPRGSVVKPEDAEESIIERIYKCENDNCLQPITVYWYRPKRQMFKA